MRLPTLSIPGIGALLLVAAAGCQSVARLSSDVALLPTGTSKPLVTLTNSSIPSRGQNAHQSTPVTLMGLSSDDAADGSDHDLSPTSQAPTSHASRAAAQARDVRPIFLGQRGIRDPNAEDSDENLQQIGADETAGPARSSMLLGDDPGKLFRSPQTLVPIAAQEEPGLSFPGDQAAGLQPLPSLIGPPPSSREEMNPALSPYEQALQSPAHPPEFGSDLRKMFPTLWDDTKSLFTWQNVAVITVAAGGAVALREADVDHDVRQYTLGHEKRWGEGSVVLRQFGEPLYQVPVLAAVYGYSVWKDDPYLHDYSCATICAYGLNGITTVLIKWTCDTQRPTSDFYNGRWGFPSFHTSSLFTIGAVTEEYYGCAAGLPIYVLGGLVGWSRIDQREHDLSDVLFGAVLGYVIGKTVGANHRAHDGQSTWNVQPYYDTANAASGVSVETRF